MQKKANLLIFIFLALTLLANAKAQEETSYDSELQLLSEQYSSAKLPKAGITPESKFYIIDILSEKLVNNQAISRLEKVAEIKATIEKDPEAAKISLRYYLSYSQKAEKDIAPDQVGKEAENSAAIYNELKTIEETLPEEQKITFVEPIKKQETNILLSGKAATALKAICSESDPNKFYRICKTENNAPRWQKELYAQEAIKQEAQTALYLDRITICLKDAGNCNCNGLAIKEYESQCKIFISEVDKCRMQNDNGACIKIEQQTTKLKQQTAPHLLKTVKLKESALEEAKLQVVHPSICINLDISDERNRKTCIRNQIIETLPAECKYVVPENILSEIEARELCAQALFELDKPTECAETNDAKKCAQIVFEKTVPECVEAGIIGELYDNYKCLKIIEEVQVQNIESVSAKPYTYSTCKTLDYYEKLDCYNKQLETIRGQANIAPVKEERIEEVTRENCITGSVILEDCETASSQNQENSEAIINEEAEIEAQTEIGAQAEDEETETTTGQQANVKSATQASRFSAIITGNSIFAAEDNSQSKTNRFIDFYFSS